MARAKKLPSGNWRCRVYLGEIDGKKKFKSITASSKKEAEFLAAQFKMELDQHSSDDCTIDDAIDRYITIRESVLSPSTVREYRLSQKRDYKLIGSYSVQAIRSEDVQAFINDFAKSHSPKTTKNVYGLLRSSIYAILPNKALAVSLPQIEPVKRNIPTDEAFKVILDNAGGDLRKAILLAAFGTLRRGEVCAVRYEDIAGNTLHVHSDIVKDVNGNWVEKSMPKNSASDRYVVFSDAVIKQLGKGKGRIVKMTPTKVTRNFGNLKRKAGIDTRFHDLRHYAASIMHAIGVPDQYIMERGGWSSDVVLKSVYRNVLDDKQREFSDRTNDYMDKFFNE